MERQNIIDTIKLALEFVERARRCADLRGVQLRRGCTETGALRRQSMELTRALARLRRGRWG